jgi:tetratricopeptide (TPR) repeat protein
MFGSITLIGLVWIGGVEMRDMMGAQRVSGGWVGAGGQACWAMGPALTVDHGTTLALAQNPASDLSRLWPLLQRGNYAEAEEGYRRAIQQEGKPAAYLGLARVLHEVGRYEEALRVLEEGLGRNPSNADLLAQRAAVYHQLGRWDEAERDVEAALKVQADHFPARWVKACLLRDQGEQAAADKQIRWLVQAYTQTSGTEAEIRDAERLLIVGQAGVENARRHRLHRQFQFILQEIYPEALRADPLCWQAHYWAARLLLEKHNSAEAEAELDRALTINPRSADVLAVKGRLAWVQGRVMEAQQNAERALKVHPRHVEALLLLADMHLLTDDLVTAERYITRALAAAPRAEAVWARRAVLAHLQGSASGMDQAAQEVARFCRTPGVWHLETAELLMQLKRYTLAEQHYQQAMKCRPDLSAGVAGLAMLYWQLGREEEARPLLQQASAADPFHVRIYNALQVLKHLDGYQRRQTEHFVIRYRAADQVLAAWLAEDLERWYQEYRQLYAAAPPGKVLVEIMASREMFSGRLLSLPGLPGAAQGASTGPLLVIPSPHVDGQRRLYNWTAVVRHELTHVFNLQQSDYRVPIWLTEGLAVRAEGNRRFLQHRQLLRQRLAQGRLYDLQTIAQGYHHFARPEEVILAYYQGWLYVEYLAQRYGDKVFAQLLSAYRQGLTTADALQRICGIDIATLERGYRQFVRHHVGPLPSSQNPPSATLADLETAWHKNNSDADIGSRLAAEYLRRRRLDDARRIAEQLWQSHKGHTATALVLAELKQPQDLAGAIVILEEALAVHPEEVQLLHALAPLLVRAQREEQALKALERLYQLHDATEEELGVLAALYGKLQQTDKQIQVLAERADRLPDDLVLRCQLAALCQQQGDWEQSARWAEGALRIDVHNEQAKELLVAAWRQLGRERDVQRLLDRYPR